jgi:hypothetical protein
MKHWTEQHIQQLKEQGRIVDYKENGRTHAMPPNLPITAIKKRSKYNATKTTVNGLHFASMKEANRYKELLLLLKAGAIGLLELQVPFELNRRHTFITLHSRFCLCGWIDGAKGC